MEDIEESVRKLRDKRLEEARNPDRFTSGEQALLEFVQLDLWLQFHEKAKKEAQAAERLKTRPRPRIPIFIG